MGETASARELWFSLASATLLESCVGVGSSFGLWSDNLKQFLGYSQSEVATIAAFKDLGVSLGLIAGFFADNYPPWAVLSIGAGLNFLGYFCTWLALRGYFSDTSPWKLCALALVGSHGSNWINTAGMVSMVKSFPKRSGYLVGYIKGFIGLSAAMFVQLYCATFYPNSVNFLLLAASVPCLVAFLVVPRIRVHNSVNNILNFNMDKKFYQLGLGSASLAVYIFSCSVLRISFEISRLQNVGLLLGMLALLSYPFLIIGNAVSHSSQLPASLAVESPEVCERIIPHSSLNQNETSSPSVSLGQPHLFSQAAMRLEFWLMFLSMMLGCGSALAVADNLGQIASALGHNSSLLVSLYSIMSFFGFLIGGYSSEILKGKGCPRTVFGLLLFPFLAVALASLSTGWNVAVHGGVMAAGFSFGSMWAITPAILADLFGFRAYASLYNLLIVSNPCGSYILSVLVVGRLFDEEERKEGGLTLRLWAGGEEASCHGQHCFGVALSTLAVCSCCAAIVWFFLWRRTGFVYRCENEAK